MTKGDAEMILDLTESDESETVAAFEGDVGEGDDGYLLRSCKDLIFLLRTMQETCDMLDQHADDIEFDRVVGLSDPKRLWTRVEFRITEIAGAAANSVVGLKAKQCALKTVVELNDYCRLPVIGLLRSMFSDAERMGKSERVLFSGALADGSMVTLIES